MGGVDASKWLKDSLKMSLPEMKKAAAGLGVGDVHFDWDIARSVEGYFRIKGSTDFCIQRGIAFAPYADCIWMETGKPILQLGLVGYDRHADGDVHLGPRQVGLLLAVHNSGWFPLQLPQHRSVC